MKDSYTEIMDQIRAKCPDCARHVEEEHRLLAKLNSPELNAVLDAAQALVDGQKYVRGMPDSDPHKGTGNRLADALDAYARSMSATDRKGQR